jgi:hypothetical protein
MTAWAEAEWVTTGVLTNLKNTLHIVDEGFTKPLYIAENCI